MTEIVSLKSRADFLALKQGGARRFSSLCLLAFYLNLDGSNNESRVRYAFSINSRFYCAVERNRIKRLVKARLMSDAPTFSSNTDILFVLSSKERHGLKTRELFERQLHTDLDHLFTRIKQIKKLVL